MPSRGQFYSTVFIVLCAVVAAVADNPHLTPSDVLRVADAVADRHADLRSYKRESLRMIQLARRGALTTV